MTSGYTIFSQRGRETTEPLFNELPREFAVQMLWIMRRTLFRLTEHFGWEGEESFNSCAQFISEFVCEERGVSCIGTYDKAEDNIEFVLTRSDSLHLVLDVVEVTLRTLTMLEKDKQKKLQITPNEAIERVNQRLIQHNLGYRFDASALIFVRVDSSLAHDLAIQPALALLSGPAYKLANEEFVEGLEDYRKADYDDCLTKCGSAFESVMKVICEQKQWPYNHSDAANTLLNTVVPRCNLDAFFVQPLLLIATIRNRLSRSHGQGIVEKNPQQHIAQYAVNATASAILLLHEAAKGAPNGP